jgi:hypothetical protein
MEILIGISVVFGFLAFFFLFRIFHCVRRRRYFRASGSCVSCVVSAALAGTATMFAFSYLSYVRLTDEQEVSQIEFRRINPEEFQARLITPHERDRFFILRGDEWQMDARIVTWKPPATILGLDPIYRLDRLSGRYSQIDREQNEARTVHSLSTSTPVDIWTVAQKFPAFVPGIDAYYGTATYVPMTDGARFAVSLSRDALIARPANDRARQAVGEWQ